MVRGPRKVTGYIYTIHGPTQENPIGMYVCIPCGVVVVQRVAVAFAEERVGEFGIR